MINTSNFATRLNRLFLRIRLIGLHCEATAFINPTRLFYTYCAPPTVQIGQPASLTAVYQMRSPFAKIVCLFCVLFVIVQGALQSLSSASGVCCNLMHLETFEAIRSHRCSFALVDSRKKQLVSGIQNQSHEKKQFFHIIMLR